jgi:predicted RNase H-like nuclease (RuvC/YqgF family)
MPKNTTWIYAEMDARQRPFEDRIRDLEARNRNLHRELDRRAEVITHLLDQLAEREAEIRDKDDALRELILNV